MSDPKNYPTFGSTFKKEAFLLNDTDIHVNHGSWGTVPKEVFEAQNRQRLQLESGVDRYFREVIPKGWFENCDTVARFLKLTPKNTVFVENATNAINAVLKSWPLKPGDQILVNSWTYLAIQNAAKQAAFLRGAEVLLIDITLPIESKEAIVEKYRETFQKHPNIKLAIIDYISSPTATLFPIPELVQLCRQHEVLSLIDGAHTPGHIEPRVEEIMPDFYTGNMHKWAFTPRGCAVLWVHPDHQKVIKPLVTSHSYNVNDWRQEFFTQATRDATTYLVAADAVRFYESIGGIERITKYNTTLLDEAVQYLVELWGTKKFPIPADMEAPFMRLIRLPDVPKYAVENPKKSYLVMDGLSEDLLTKFNIYSAPYFVQGEPWMRISAMVHNSPELYRSLGDAVLTLQKEAKAVQP